MDCDLPDIPGYEVTRRWREREAVLGLVPTPIIAVSASTDTGHTASCFEAGMDGVLKKPIKLAKLQDTLQLWCEAAAEPVPDETVVMMDHDAMLQSLEMDLDALQQSWKEEDCARATHFAHRLVGAAEVLGAMSLAESARQLETRFKQGEGDVPEFTLQSLEPLRAHLHDWARTVRRS
ncbi:response regulator [Oceanisphaera sp. KMM 10153]|uniref:response regulator n=1 Tax=Oceanisphaera submarina TaxID=3390193 RepID=UPI003974C76D